MGLPLNDDLAEMFTDTVAIERFIQTTGDGDDTYGSPMTVPCRISEKIQKVLMPDGREVVSRVKITINAKPKCTVMDRFTFPDGYLPRTAKPMAVSWHQDENGPHHETAYF